MNNPVNFSLKQSVSLSLFQRSKMLSRFACVYKFILGVARRISFAYDDETCNQLSLQKLGKKRLTSTTLLPSRSISVALTFKYQENTFKNAIATGKKGAKKVVVLSGPSLDQWPKIYSNTALSALEGEMKTNNLKTLMMNNKPSPGEAAVINLSNDSSGVTTIVILPYSTKSTTKDLQNAYLDAAIKLTDHTARGDEVYLFPPATTAGAQQGGPLADGNTVCLEMADTLGATGKVTVVSKQRNLFSSLAQEGMPSVVKDNEKNSVSGKGSTDSLEGTTNKKPNSRLNRFIKSKSSLDESTASNTPHVNKEVVNPVGGRHRNELITVPFIKPLQGINNIDIAMHNEGMLGYAVEYFEGAKAGTPYSVVNAANSFMSHGAGIAKAIKDKAGDDYQDECKKLIAQRENKNGVCVTTDSYDLKSTQPHCHRIHNVVAPRKLDVKASDYDNTLRKYQENFKNAWIELFESGSKNAKEEIVCCYIGCSIFGGSGEDMALGLYSAMQDNRLKNLVKNGTLPKLHLVGWIKSKSPHDGDTLRDFESKWLNLMTGDQQVQNTDQRKKEIVNGDRDTQTTTKMLEETVTPKVTVDDKNENDENDGNVKLNSVVIYQGNTNQVYDYNVDGVDDKEKTLKNDEKGADKIVETEENKITEQLLPEQFGKGTEKSTGTAKDKLESASAGGAVGGGKEESKAEMIQLNLGSDYATVAAAISDTKKRLLHVLGQEHEKLTVVSEIPAEHGHDPECISLSPLSTCNAGELCCYTVGDSVKYLTIDSVEGMYGTKGYLQCPLTGKLIAGIVKGNQPNGTMKIDVIDNALDGYPDCATIQIKYNMPDGMQGDEHENPGEAYKGLFRIAYLPDNEKGRLVLKMLQLAFKRKLIFTIGTSVSRNEDNVITWNDVHHKTVMRHAQYGYPDSKYLDRVTDELASKYITPRDVVE
ncbi:MAG: macro domain-containing protein [Endozoicomonadaceae bacterium]|nr:macro domain-containing protein [Endozoicomonadaceae bacterium]